MSKLSRWIVAALLIIAASAAADVPLTQAVSEAERTEDLRILHAYAVQNVHDAKALAMYLQGWAGPDRSGEAESLMQEAEDVYGGLCGIDSGSQGLLAEIAIRGESSPSPDQLDLLQRARRTVTELVNGHHARTLALKTDLIRQINESAAQKTKWQIESRPEPWPDPAQPGAAAREAGRLAGHQRGVFLRDNFFELPPDDIDYCLAKANKIGISYAHVLYDPICNWAAMEPQPGTYDFAKLDATLGTFARHNVRVCLMLRSLTGSPPPWHVEKFKTDCQFTATVTDRQGKQSQQISGINVFHQPTGDAYAKFLAALAAGWLAGNMLRITYPGTWYRYPDRQVGDFGVRSYFLSARRTQEFAPVVLNTAPAPAPVAILWSQPTRRIDRSRELFMSAIAWGHLLKRIQVDFDYIPDDAGGFDFNFAERLKPYKLLILPNTQAMASDTCNAIREWVNAGGALLGFGAPGIYDETGARRPAIALADVFGADVARMRLPGLIRPDKLETTHPEGAYIPYPPVDYKFRTNLTAALKPQGGTPRAWFVGDTEEPAIVENAFGQGKALLSGFPIGHEYWQAHPYEVSFGLTYFRLTDVYELSRYETWVLKELEKRGIARSVTLPVARFLRAQSNDDPDWSHTYRNGPEYAEYVYEQERPVRSIIAFCRKRDGIDNTYIGISHTEGNYSYGRGYFRCTLSGAAVTASVAIPPVEGQTPVVVDARFGVPVPSALKGQRVEFATWLPLAQSAAFAVAPTGSVRLFGDGNPTGVAPGALAKTTAAYADGKKLADVETLDRDRVTEFLRARRGKTVVIAYGDTRFRPAAEQLADKLRKRYQIESRITCEGPRGQCSKSYMLGFGFFQPDPAPVRPDVLIGNCQDNGLMWRFIMRDARVEMGWLPLEVNQTFPGLGRAIIMLSCPISTQLDGKPRTEVPADQQLVIGASSAAEAVKGVEAVK